MSGRGQIDSQRLAKLAQRPGIDPRVWLTFAAVDEVMWDESADGGGMYCNCHLLASGESITAIVAVPYAGARFGAWYSPEPDDIVLVGIADGDMSNGGVVLARFYRGSDLPPRDLSAEENPAEQVTAATTNVVMRVKPGSKYILRTSGDGGAVDVKAEGNGTLSLEAAGSGDVHVKQSGSGNVFVNAAGKVYVGADSTTDGTQPPALGTDTQTYLTQLATFLQALTLPVSGAVAGPPAPGTVPQPGNLQAAKVEVK